MRLLPDGIAVGVVAPDAHAVEFCVFDVNGDEELARHRMTRRLGALWHDVIPGIGAGTRYGLRAHGPFDAWHRFDPSKLLLDPWAQALDRPFQLHPAQFTPGADTAAVVPKAVVCDLAPQPPPPPRAGPRVIYELHVRGFTRLHPGIPEPIRGTFAALAHPAAIAHLHALGVTHVELLPCAAGVDERHLPALGLSNYWNYNPLAFLAPCPKLAPGGMAEVRAAVETLRDAGIGVILDVVFNHTGESDEFGPTLSLRGLGNAAFHRLLPDGRYANDAGCGNTLALERPWPLRLVMDALRHWVLHAGVDGFRLDLAATLGRRDGGFDPDAPLLAAMRQDPLLRDRIIIAEPWDTGPGGYQLGQFPAGWGEWNDRFRDDVRRFWRADAGTLGSLATRLAGSADRFQQRPLTDSVNFVTAHDGFTLADLVRYEQRHNDANGEQNRDGAGENFSWNNGVEGETENAAVNAARGNDVRALLATLLLARGTPMLAMGDEVGRTQHGNNNAYAQDNTLSWLDWHGMDVALRDFTARLVRARLAHPALTAGTPLSAENAQWLRPAGGAMTEADWHGSRALLLLLREGDDRVLVALNSERTAQPLALPPTRDGMRWALEIDTAAQPGLALPARSVRLYAERPRPARHRGPEPAMLRELAQAAGIAPSWHDLDGREHQAAPATLQALLAAMALPAGSAEQAAESLALLRAPRALPAQTTVPLGAPIRLAVPLARGCVELHLQREDGSEAGFRLMPDAGRVTLPPQPPGNYTLRLGDMRGRLAIVPRTGFLPPAMARRFGIGVQSYALRRSGDQGIGDYTAIAQMAGAAQAAGALLLGLSPPHALPLLDRERASPYQPADRRFLEPALIDVTALPWPSPALAAQAAVFAAMERGEQVDYSAVWQAKRSVLHAAWQARPAATPALDAFRREGGTALQRFCTFSAIAEQEGHTTIQRWPVRLQHAEAGEVAAFAAGHAEALGFHAFLQWVADGQLAAAGRAGAGLYRDLAVGAAPDGAEPWSQPDGFLAGVAVGAPPDAFAPQGQVWGVPAPQPRAAVPALAQLLQANMRHAAALRVDHVMALTRLFVVPQGARGSEGTYIAYPRRHLLGQLTLASQRARCIVVGEDLGTVPPGFRAELKQAQVLSYRVLWFEREGDGFLPPEAWPAPAAACASTHDLPTLAGWWLGTDLDERQALGLLADATAARAARARDREALLATLRAAGLEPGAPPGPDFVAAVHAWLARTPSTLLLVQAEDLAGERVAVNLPGTDRERPNWRRRLAVPVDRLLETPEARATLAALAARRA